MNKVMNAKKANWVKTMVLALIAEEMANPMTVGVIAIGRQISVMYLDTKNPKIGVAKCNPYDKYDCELGIAIAYARAIGEELPCYITCDGCNDNEDEDEDEDDDWDYDDDDDYDDDEDDDDDYLTFDELGVGAKYLYGDELYIKVSEDKAYRYTDRTTVDFDCDDEIDEVIED